MSVCVCVCVHVCASGGEHVKVRAVCICHGI